MTEPSSPLSQKSRRSFLRCAALAAATPILTEAHLAFAAEQVRSGPHGLTGPDMRVRQAAPPGAVLINANENPMGPSPAACEAMAKIAPMGGRYDLFGETVKLTQTVAAQNNLPEDHIAVYAGSSEPLHYTVLAFTSPTPRLRHRRSAYEAGMVAAAVAGAKISKVPLTSDYAHDVRAMVAADPKAGVIYICNPNNPTGTLTAKTDIAWALENKPPGSVLLVDEAYIHLSDSPRAGHGGGGQGPDRAAHLLQGVRHGGHPLRAGHRPAGPTGQAETLRPERHAGHRNRCGQRVSAGS